MADLTVDPDTPLEVTSPATAFDPVKIPHTDF